MTFEKSNATKTRRKRHFDTELTTLPFDALTSRPETSDFEQNFQEEDETLG